MGYSLTFCYCNSKKEKINDLKAIGADSSSVIKKKIIWFITLLNDSITAKAIQSLPKLSYKFNVYSNWHFLKHKNLK
jgi:hypothetical protein